MKIKLIILGFILSLVACGTSEKISNQIQKEYLSKYDLKPNSSSFKYRTNSLGQMLNTYYQNNETNDTIIIIESYPNTQIPESVTATIKSKSDSMYFYTDYDNHKIIRTYNPQKNGDIIHDIFYDMVVDYLKKDKVQELKTLHEKDRRYNHTSTAYLTVLVLNNKKSEILKTLMFEEFAVDFKDSKDPAIRKLIN